MLLRPGINETDMAPHIPEAHPRTLLVANKTLRLGAMPVSRFMTGRTFFTQRLHEARSCLLCISGRYTLLHSARSSCFWSDEFAAVLSCMQLTSQFSLVACTQQHTL